MQLTTIFEKISQGSLYLLVLLLPLWFLPLTQDAVEYQKQALLLLLVFVGVTAWLTKMVYEGKAVFRFHWLHIPVLGLLFFFGISTLFSLWRYGSLWGWPLQSSDNFLTLLAFVLLYFFISQTVNNARHLFFLLAGLVLSGTLAVVFALAQMKGIFLVPFDFAQAKNFNTIGSANAVGIFAAMLLPLAFTLASRAQAVWKIVLLLGALVLFGCIALIDFSIAWIAVIAGLIVLVAFDVWSGRKHSSQGRISLPMVFVVVALFFLIVRGFSIPGAPVLPAEVSPSFQGELAILRDMVSERPLTFAIGSGPGTFVFDYTKFRSSELNQTLFWNTRFSSGKAEFFDWFVTKGAGGLLSLILVIGLAFVLGTKKVIVEKDSDDDSRFLTIGLLASLLAGSLSFALYPANFAMWFVFWMIAGSLGFLVAKQASTILLSSRPSLLAFGSSFAVLMIVIVGLGLLIIGGQKYYAEMEYLKGARAFREGNVDEAMKKVAKAANLNSAVDLYWRDLAQMFLTKANQLASDKKLSQDVREQQTGIAVNNAIAAARRAGETNPANVANWNVQGFVYRNVISVPSAEKFAQESYEKARQLEPVSPFPWTELGRVKILYAEVLANQKDASGSSSLLADALVDLEKAVSLKEDYAPAHYLIALVHESRGDQAQAIKKLEEAKLVAPNDVGLAFQLGVAYYRQDELSLARDEFERARKLNVSYSNARYMLGLVYDRLGRKEDAEAEFAVVSTLNPQNQEVKDILKNLQEGRAALEGIIPGQPPIEEIPVEISEEQ